LFIEKLKKKSLSGTLVIRNHGKEMKLNYFYISLEKKLDFFPENKKQNSIVYRNVLI